MTRIMGSVVVVSSSSPAIDREAVSKFTYRVYHTDCIFGYSRLLGDGTTILVLRLVTVALP